MRSKQCSKHTNAELMPRQTSGLWKTMHAQFHMLPVAPLNHPITQRQSEGCTKYHSNQRQSQDCTKYRSNWRQLEGCTKYRHNWLRCTGAVVNAPVSSVQSGFNFHREYTTLCFKQQAQLSQRDCTMLRVTEYFASYSRSLKVIRNDALEKGVSLLVIHCNYVSNLAPSEIFNSRSLKMLVTHRWCHEGHMARLLQCTRKSGT